MKFMHYEWSHIGPSDIIEITLDKQANVYLLDETNYHKYKNNKPYTAVGGTQVKTPAHISPPSIGHWHLCVDLAGYVGSVNVGVKLL